MNHMDENYWKNLAQSWIQSKTQQNVNPSINEEKHPDRPPRIDVVEDNHAVADMEIEEVKDSGDNYRLWNWQNSNVQMQTHQHLPVIQNFPPIHPQNFHHPPVQNFPNFPVKNFDRPIPTIPEPPMIQSFISSEDACVSLRKLTLI